LNETKRDKISKICYTNLAEYNPSYSGKQMFNWFRKKSSNTENTPAKGAEHSPSGKEALIEEAKRNTQAAREAFGPERLAELTRLIHEKNEVSPAAQARKIIAKMDTEKLSAHLRYLQNDPPTKH